MRPSTAREYENFNLALATALSLLADHNAGFMNVVRRDPVEEQEKILTAWLESSPSLWISNE